MTHPDYRRWLTLFDCVPEARRKEVFKAVVYRHLAVYCTGDDLQTFMASNGAWMRELGTSNSNFETILAALRVDPNGTTLKLSDLVKILAATIITVAWQTHMADFVGQYEEEQAAGVQRNGEMNDEEYEKVIQAFDQGIEELRYHSMWLVFSPQIASFALKAGCPVVLEDPLHTHHQRS